MLRNEDKWEKLQRILAKIKEIEAALRVEKNISADEDIINEASAKINNHLPHHVNLAFKRGSHRLVCNNNELYYLTQLYNAYAKQITKDDSANVVVSELPLDDALIVSMTNSYLVKRDDNKFQAAQFLIENDLAPTFLKEFVELENKLNSMDDSDLRKLPAMDVLEKMKETYGRDSFRGKHREQMLQVVRETRKIVEMPLEDFQNPKNEHCKNYCELAREVHKTGVLRIVAASMLTVLAAVLLAASIPLLICPLYLPVSMAIVNMCAILSAFAMTGGIVLSPIVGCSTIFSGGNRTRQLGNMMEMLGNAGNVQNAKDNLMRVN